MLPASVAEQTKKVYNGNVERKKNSEKIGNVVLLNIRDYDYDRKNRRSIRD